MLNKLRKASFSYSVKTSFAFDEPLASRLDYGTASIRCRFTRYSRRINQKEKRREKQEDERKEETAERRRIKKHTFRRRRRRGRRRIRFSEYFLLITIQLPSRCNERARRRCLFGQLSMRRTQVELLSSSRAGTMTWWRGSRVKAQ